MQRAFRYPRSLLIIPPDVKLLPQCKNVNPQGMILDMYEKYPYVFWNSQMNDLPIQKKRIHYNQLFQTEKLSEFYTLIRVNPIENENEVHLDVSELLSQELKGGLLIPNLESKEELRQYLKILDKYEKKKIIPSKYFDVWLEIGNYQSATLLSDFIEVARDRISGVIFNQDIFFKCHKIKITKEAALIPISLIMGATKANKLPCLDGALTEIFNFEKLQSQCEFANEVGFDGKVALTPEQIFPIHKGFNYDLFDQNWANKVRSQGRKNEKLYWHEREIARTIGKLEKESSEIIFQSFEKEKNEMIRKQTKSIPFITAKKEKGWGSDIITPDTVSKQFYSESTKTIHTSTIDMWNASFFPYHPLTKNQEIAAELGFKNMITPFGIAKTLGVSLASEKLTVNALGHLFNEKCIYINPLFPGDTVRNAFQIQSIKKTSKKHRVIIKSKYFLINQKDELIYSYIKNTLAYLEDEFDYNRGDSEDSEYSPLKENILNISPEKLKSVQSHSEINEGDLLIHKGVKPIEKSEVFQICGLSEMPHPHALNHMLYPHESLFVPAPFVFSSVFSMCFHSFGFILHEDILFCLHPNRTNYGDLLSSLSYVESIKKVPNKPHFEELIIVTIGVKNTILNYLQETPIPLDLFIDVEKKVPTQFEKICEEYFPIFYKKIVCVSKRRLYRHVHVN